MVLHMQVFALTEWMAVHPLPPFYRDLAAGLRWVYFYLPTPFAFSGWNALDSRPPPPAPAAYPNYTCAK